MISRKGDTLSPLVFHQLPSESGVHQKHEGNLFKNIIFFCHEKLPTLDHLFKKSKQITVSYGSSMCKPWPLCDSESLG